MSAFTAEVIGTMMLVLFGNGVVANVVLAKTKAGDGGWLLISAGWGVAVYVGAFCANEFSAAHLNPAVSIAMTVAGELSVDRMFIYIVAQLFGAMIGAALVYLFYRSHFNSTEDPNAKLACFSTSPAIPGNLQAFFCEVVGTFALILPIFLMVTPRLIQSTGPVDTDPTLGLGSLGLLPVALFSIRDRHVVGWYDGLRDQSGPGSGATPDPRDFADPRKTRQRLGIRLGTHRRSDRRRGNGGIGLPRIVLRAQSLTASSPTHRLRR